MRFCGTAQGVVPGNTGDGLLYEPGRERLRIGTTEGRFRMIMPDLLHVFRIRGLEKTNPVYLLYRKEQPWTEGMEMFTALLRQRCAQIAALQERI